MQPALKRSGIVDGYTHVCRRKGCTHREEHADAELRQCPVHAMKLWPKARVRHIRFHDLRYAYDSVLLMLGANVVSVQRLFGHSDPKITERRYSHFTPDFMSAEVNRLRFGLAPLAPSLPTSAPAEPDGRNSQVLARLRPRLGTSSVQQPGSRQEEGRDPTANPSEVPA